MSIDPRDSADPIPPTCAFCDERMQPVDDVNPHYTTVFACADEGCEAFGVEKSREEVEIDEGNLNERAGMQVGGALWGQVDLARVVRGPGSD